MKQPSSFRKSLLSTCVAAVALSSVSTIALAQEEDYMVEEVVVTGIRSALNRSVDVKRSSATVVDAISAEDIGKLPDTTIADSLQRVSGIQIRRSAGEGANVNIRGMSQVSTLMNGEQFLSAGSITTAQPDFTDIPAELLSRVDVLKSSQASTLAAGVAGTIDLKTRRPLDLDSGWTFAGSAEGSQGNYTDDDTGHKLSGFLGFNNGDNLGALLSVTSSEATLANYRYGMYSEWLEGYAVDVNNDGTTDRFFGSIDYGITNRTTERDRLGVASTVQFQLNDDVEFIADVFYTKMDQGDYVNGLIADNAWSAYDWATPGEGAINHGPSASDSSQTDFWTAPTTNLDAVRVAAKAETQISNRESLNVNLQSNIQFNDNFRGTFRYVYGNATNDYTSSFADANLTTGEQHSLNTSIGGVVAPVNPDGYGPGRIPIVADFSGKHPTFTYPQGFGDDINRYGLVSAFSQDNRNEEADLQVFRFDGIYEFDDGIKLDFGYRYADREVTRNQYNLVAPFTVKGADGNDVTVYSKWKDSGLEGVVGGDTIAQTFKFTELQNLGLIHSVSDFGPASSGNSYFFIDPKAMKNTFAFHELLYPGNVKHTDPAESYIVQDETHTFYLQGSFEGEMIFPFQANIGLQYIETDITVTQYAPAFDDKTIVVDGVRYEAVQDGVVPGIAGTDVIDRSFSDVLPRFNIAWDTTDSTKLRLAYTKTMSQLDTNDLGRGTAYTTANVPKEGVFRVNNVSRYGNPHINPWRADNFDISYEWYFSDSGTISIGGFYVDMETSIVNNNIQIDRLPDSDGVIRFQDAEGEALPNTITMSVRENAEGSVTKGVELSYQQAFDFLPGLLSGLGTTLNYTYTEAKSGKGASSTDFYGNTLPQPDNSEDQVNAVLWYEYDQWQARIAYNYRSERYIGREWNSGSPAAFWQAPTTYVDASVSYDVNDNVSVYLQGTNLTKEYEETYMQWSGVKVNQNIYEARYTVGVRAKF